jgi:dGTPase
VAAGDVVTSPAAPGDLRPAAGAGYDEAARERWVDEPPKRPTRGDFARDRARVVHSSSLRRLAAKTQVVGPGTSDFVRNRLTHSLEVAQVGRELGERLGCDPDVVDTACLAHDLGHPPFGHNGERALAEVAAGIGGFEGNAQTLRLLTRLEAKRTRPDGGSAGLNLTRASLDAATKYPWEREEAPRPVGAHADGTPVAGVKFGAYAPDREVFAWVRSGAPSRRRCLEAQVMDWADDVAYSVHDVEDGIVAGRVDLAALRSRSGAQPVLAVARLLHAPDADEAELGAALARLEEEGLLPEGHDGGRRALAALKDTTSRLIGRFCEAAERATRARVGPGPLTRYAADLEVPRPTRLECAVLKGVAAHFVMRTSERVVLLERQRQLVAELAELLLARAPASLEPPFARDFDEAPDGGSRLRVVVDQVASLTDPSAVELHRRLSGRGGR